MTPPQQGLTRRPPQDTARTLALVAVLVVLSSLVHVASAQCAKTATSFPLSGSDFSADYNVTASNATRACFQIGNGRSCDVDAGLCCLGENTRGLVKYTSVTFRLSNGTGCLPDAASLKKTVKWSANGKTKKAKIVGTNVSVPIGVVAAAPVTLCADFLTGFDPSCTGMGKLCEGTTCKVSIQLSKVTKKPDALNKTTWTTGVSCCLSGEADLRTCDVASQQGCAAKASCAAVVVEGSSRGVCSCLTGYGGDGYTGCTDNDECLTDNGGCHPTATCTNTDGGRGCRCTEGYTGDGFNCTDECGADHGGCDANAICKNTAGGFTCTCKTGYTGNGTSCTDVGECATSNGGCDANAVCKYTAGGRSCTCKAGYTGNGTSCTDVDECATNNGGCDANAACNNTAGGRTCTCKDGFKGTGTICQVIDPCDTDNGGCDWHATCNFTGGAVTCQCRQGFTGDGIKCTGPNLRCWGSDSYNQTSVPGDITTAVAVYTGPSWTCAVTRDGRVRCFGDNTFGSLDVPSNVTANVGALPASVLGLVSSATCVLAVDGAIQCFGWNFELSLPAVPPELALPGAARGVTGGSGFACAVKTGGSVICWGTLKPPVPWDLQPNGSATGVMSAGQGYVCVVTPLGTVRCLGSNPWGALDVPATLTGAVQVCTSDEHACAAKGDGTVACWGKNDLGQAQPPADLTDAVMVACGDRFTVALTKSGAVRVWGKGITPVLAAVPEDLGAVSHISAGQNLICAVSYNGTNECQLGTDNCHPDATCTDTIGGFQCTCKAGFIGDGVENCTEVNSCKSGAVKCDGNATCSAVTGGYGCTCNPGYTGDGVTSCIKHIQCWSQTNDPVINTPPPDLGEVKAVSASRSQPQFTCAIRANDSNVQCWGYNVGFDDHQLDVPSDLGPVKEVSVEAIWPCALTAAGAVRCWGNNTLSDLGSTVPPSLSANGSTKTISLGYGYGCAVTSAGAVVAWGGGAPTVDPSFQVAGAAESIACGGGQICVLTPSKLLRCFGNDFGGHASVPLAVANVAFLAVSAGKVHTCALAVNGTVICFGALDPVTGGSDFPGYLPAGLGPVKVLSAGHRASTGLVTVSGALRMVPEVAPVPGSNVTFTAQDTYGPTPTDLGPVAFVSLGESHACAILAV